MKCDDMIPGGQCQAKAKWWFRLNDRCVWHPRCGRHAKMPPFTKRERHPITERPPFEGQREGTDSK